MGVDSDVMPGTSPDFEIRAASPRDAESLALLRSAMFRELGRVSPMPGDQFEMASAAAFRARMEAGSCWAWLAETAQEPIGSTALLVFPRLPSPESAVLFEGYLLNVYTVAEWRRRGVAQALVAAAVARARELGLARVRLHTSPEGEPLYGAAGFRFRDDEMELEL